MYKQDPTLLIARLRPTPASGPRSKASKSVLRPLDGLPILIVEDDVTSAKLLTVVLQGEGCQVEVAESAEEALASVARIVPRIITIDLVLPRMSGLVLAHRLRTEPRTADALIVAVTSFNDQAERMCRLAGCDAYVRKPIDALAFPRRLIALLGRQK